jgi:hypothetical protein
MLTPTEREDYLNKIKQLVLNQDFELAKEEYDTLIGDGNCKSYFDKLWYELIEEVDEAYRKVMTSGSLPTEERIEVHKESRRLNNLKQSFKTYMMNYS